MALSLSARLGLTRWSAGTDPFSRTQLDADHAKIDLWTAIDFQVATLADRPAPGVRGRYVLVIEGRTIWRDNGVAWDLLSETDPSGSPIYRRMLPAEKNAADAPSTYPLGVSTFETSVLGGWPAINLQVVTQRSSVRATQTLSQANTGRTWVRTQSVDTWGRFTEVSQTLTFTSTTRPNTGVYDGLRGYETDTGGTVVWRGNRWTYELLADTGWVNIIPAAPHAALSTSEYPQVRNRHGVLHFQGAFSSAGLTANTTFVVATLDPDDLPRQNAVVALGTNIPASVAIGFLSAFTGELQIRTGASVAPYYKLDAFSGILHKDT